MPRLACTVCSRPDRAQVEAALGAPGSSQRKVSKAFGLGLNAVNRHAMNHMGRARLVVKPPSVAKLAAMQAVVAGTLVGSDLVSEVKRLKDRANKLGSMAESSGDLKTALLAIRELTRLCELQGRLALESAQGTSAQVANHPAWLRVSGSILTALRGFPEASHAVAVAMANELGVMPDVSWSTTTQPLEESHD